MGGGGFVWAEIRGTDEELGVRGLRFGGTCLGECRRVMGNVVRRACVVLMVGVSCSMCMVGVVLVCAGVMSG